MEQASIFDYIEDVTREDESPPDATNVNTLFFPLSDDEKTKFKTLIRRAMEHYGVDNISDAMLKHLEKHFSHDTPETIVP